MKLISSRTIRDRDYFLYQDVSGAADKVEFLVLFDQAVEFDACGIPNAPASDKAFIEYGSEGGPQEKWIRQVVISNGRFNIQYSTVQVSTWPVQWIDK